MKKLLTIALIYFFASCSSDSNGSSILDTCACFRNTYEFDEKISSVLISTRCDRDGEILAMDERLKTIIKCSE